MSVWILTAGSYSAYHVVGAFTDEAHARRIAEELNDADDGYGDYAVEEVEPVGDDLRVEHLYTTLTLQFGIKWNGNIGIDALDDDRFRPVRRVRVLGLPTDEGPLRDVPATPGPCVVSFNAFETGYTFGVTCTVSGTDSERVRKVFTEQRAQMIADPAAATVTAWAARPHPAPGWVWQREENRPILDALRRAGVQ